MSAPSITADFIEPMSKALDEVIGTRFSSPDPEAPAKLETRAWPLAEVRVETNDGKPKITGYAAVFNAKSEMLSDWFGDGYTEVIRSGAFAKTIQEEDIRALVNHDSNYVLGRNRAGTLSLIENRKGLQVEIEPPDTQWSRDLQISMKRGDVSQMSFGFQVIKDRWTDNKEDKSLTRELLEVKLFDVSVVTFPAYPQTSAIARDVWDEAGINVRNLSSLLLRARAGLPLSSCDGDCLRAAIAALTAQLPQEPAPATPADVSLLRRRLDLLELTI